MNKKGSVMWGIVVFLIIWVSGILFLPFITDTVDAARTGLSCSDTSISSFSKINCLFTDITIPYFIWTLAAIALGFIVGGYK